jgi:hypothetical protein
MNIKYLGRNEKRSETEEQKGVIVIVTGTGARHKHNTLTAERTTDSRFCRITDEILAPVSCGYKLIGLPWRTYAAAR